MAAKMYYFKIAAKVQNQNLLSFFIMTFKALGAVVNEDCYD